MYPIGYLKCVVVVNSFRSTAHGLDLSCTEGGTDTHGALLLKQLLITFIKTILLSLFYLQLIDKNRVGEGAALGHNKM